MWIEIARGKTICCFWTSRLARALWIEIPVAPETAATLLVEARESLVDRNGTCSIHSSHIAVEARESLVDRNPAVPAPQSLSACRGSREPCGSKFPNHRHNLHRLLSRLARALWIEMSSAVPGRPSALSRLSRALWI